MVLFPWYTLAHLRRAVNGIRSRALLAYPVDEIPLGPTKGVMVVEIHLVAVTLPWPRVDDNITYVAYSQEKPCR